MRSSLRSFPPILASCLTLLTYPLLQARQQQQAPAQDSSLTIKSNVNEVLVPVVVRDAQGHAVGNLKKEDFQVFDNGKPQVITGFTLVQRAAPMTRVNSPTPAPIDLPTALRPPPAPERFVALLFDDLNLSTGDLIQAQKAAIRILDGSLLPSDIAAVLSTSGIDSGFTFDHNGLEETILSLKVNRVYQHDPNDCPNVDYYQGDLIVNKQDPTALTVATNDTLSCANLDPAMYRTAEKLAMAAARRAVENGDQDARVTLDFLRSTVRNMGTLPGQRVLILVSPGFLSASPEALTLKSQLLDAAAQSNVTISAIDARGLYITEPGASQRDSHDAFAAKMQDQYRHPSMGSSGDVMAELADGTGGTYFHNNNDLATGFSRLLSEPTYLYLLTFSPVNLKPNGRYHELKVKVNQHGLWLQARRGYSAPKPEQTKK
jgi:VWFA-related protein